MKTLEEHIDMLREENTRLAYRLWLVERLEGDIRLQAPQIAGALHRIMTAEPTKLQEDQCPA